MKTKICTTCRIEKNLSEFNKDKYNVDNLQCSCNGHCKTALGFIWKNKKTKEIIY